MPNNLSTHSDFLTGLATFRDWSALILFMAAYFGSGLICCWGIIAAIRGRK